MIEYRTDKIPERDELVELFLSVEWSSGHFPDQLSAAIPNYPTLLTAWDDGKLIGLAASMDDGVMNAYLHYLLVNPQYQGQGIGSKLMQMLKEKYANFLRILLVAYPEGVPFYEKFGFKAGKHSVAMYLTSLWT